MQNDVSSLHLEPGATLPQAEATMGWYLWWKPRLDTALALLLLIPSIPVILLLATLVRLTSRGPAFYTQRRQGQGGRPFTIFKIRTMYDQSERNSGIVWSLPDDPRITPVGRLLRATHLDELPQLFNVLRGEMSLIGPRPERPEIATQLDHAYPGYHDRLLVRPGVTGLAQIQLPPDREITGVGCKLSYDRHYIENLSVGLDLRILAGTALKVCGVPFPAIRSLLRFPSYEVDGSPRGVSKNTRTSITDLHFPAESKPRSTVITAQS